MMKQLNLFLLASVNASGAGLFDYLEQGTDWNKNANWVCGSGQQ